MKFKRKYFIIEFWNRMWEENKYKEVGEGYYTTYLIFLKEKKNENK